MTCPLSLQSNLKYDLPYFTYLGLDTVYFDKLHHKWKEREFMKEKVFYRVTAMFLYHGPMLHLRYQRITDCSLAWPACLVLIEWLC